MPRHRSPSKNLTRVGTSSDGFVSVVTSQVQPGSVRRHTYTGALGARPVVGSYAARASREEAVVSVQHHHLHIGSRWVPTASDETFDTIKLATEEVIAMVMPFGGCKQSGIGREKSLAAIDHYTQLQSVHVGTDPVEAP